MMEDEDLTSSDEEGGFLVSEAAPPSDDGAAESAELNLEEILRLAEETEFQELNPSRTRSLALKLERAIGTNLEMRSKFPDDPTKFMDSEIELAAAVKALEAVAASPALYPYLLHPLTQTDEEILASPTSSAGSGGNVITSLLGLLDHENLDVSIAVIWTLHELIASASEAAAPARSVVDHPDHDDSLDDGEEMRQIRSLVRVFIVQRGLQLVTEHLEKLDEDEPEDANCVFQSLALLESVIEVGGQQPMTSASNEDGKSVDALPGGASSIVWKLLKQTAILPWLLKRLDSRREVNQNSLYCSELLSIILQQHLTLSGAALAGVDAERSGERNSGSEAQRQFRDHGGFRILPQLLASWHKKDPESAEAREHAGNLFDCLTAAVQQCPANQLALAAKETEALELCVSCIRHEVWSKGKSLELLEATLRDCVPACERFVEAGGLRVIFRSLQEWRGKWKKEFARRSEELVLAILSHMFCGLSDMFYLRLLNKWREKNGLHLERLVELWNKYDEQVREVEAVLDDQDRQLQFEIETQKERLAARLSKDASAPEDRMGPAEILKLLDSEEVRAARKFERWNARMDAGLYCLQLGSFLIAFLLTCDVRVIGEKLRKLLRMHNIQPEVQIRGLLIEYILDGMDETDRQTHKLQQILLFLIHRLLEVGAQSPSRADSTSVSSLSAEERTRLTHRDEEKLLLRAEKLQEEINSYLSDGDAESSAKKMGSIDDSAQKIPTPQEERERIGEKAPPLSPPRLEPVADLGLETENSTAAARYSTSPPSRPSPGRSPEPESRRDRNPTRRRSYSRSHSRSRRRRDPRRSRQRRDSRSYSPDRRRRRKRSRRDSNRRRSRRRSYSRD